MDSSYISTILLFLFVTIVYGITPYFPKSCVSISQSRLPPPTYENVILYGYVYLRLEVAGPYWCARRCLQQAKCKSLNYHVPSSTCQLNSAFAGQDPGALVMAQDFIHYHKNAIPTYFLGACEGHDCHPDALCQPLNHENYTCICQNKAYSVNNCSHSLPTDACTDLPSDYCMNGGRCMEDVSGNATCQCLPGITGPRCDDVVCQGYSHPDSSPNSVTPGVEVTWSNEVGELVDIFWLHADGSERYAFSIPAAGERDWPAMVDYVWIARDRMTRRLLPVEGACSFLIPSNHRYVKPIITAI